METKRGEVSDFHVKFKSCIRPDFLAVSDLVLQSPIAPETDLTTTVLFGVRE